jgi:small-conductance mechanosensitive channel
MINSRFDQGFVNQEKLMKLIYGKLTLVVLMLLLISACAGSGNPTPTTDAPSQNTTPSDQGNTDGSGLNTVPTRTPEPTATPGLISQEVSEFVDESNLGEDFLLWLKFEDWINLGVSILYVLGGYLVGTWVVRWLLPRIVRRTETTLDNQLLKVAGSELRWLIVIIILQFATERLTFISFGLKNALADLYFLIAIVVLANLAWRLINLAAAEAHQRAVDAGRGEGYASLIMLIIWALRFIVIVVGASFVLSHFGVNITGFAILLVVILVILSFAGSDTVADIVAGIMILTDRPFRIGDRIDISELGTWGDVVSIGMRSTQILTRDHRMVIVPNSTIGKSQIVNYSFPDSHYRLESYFLVSDERDLEEMRQIIIKTIQEMENVLDDKPVQALVEEIGDGSIRFRVRWWISSYIDTRFIYDHVNTAVYYAIKAAGIKLASDSYDLNVSMNSGLVEPPNQSDERELE